MGIVHAHHRSCPLSLGFVDKSIVLACAMSDSVSNIHLCAQATNVLILNIPYLYQLLCRPIIGSLDNMTCMDCHDHGVAVRMPTITCDVY